ncbi:MAG: PadR family transcriptional regulator [Candidatus Ancillula sp.]|jgi:DNA-binding PadR family transcriptional regulator|nr:PadR family transcriptional regulator [Candidatus Ancillula sp.]
MSTREALLGIISLEPSYGYELKQKYDHLFGQSKPILFGQVYSTIARFLRDGLIEECPTDGSQDKSVRASKNVGAKKRTLETVGTTREGPDKKQYSITSAGHAEIEKWLHTPEEPVPNLQFTLYMKSMLSILKGEDPKKYLDLQRGKHIQKMRELTHMKLQAVESSHRENAMLIDYAIFHLEADLKWIEKAVLTFQKV